MEEKHDTRGTMEKKVWETPRYAVRRAGELTDGKTVDLGYDREGHVIGSGTGAGSGGTYTTS